jgi:hypothetical protein
MCGITGVIGRSSESDLSYKIITNLMRENQIRGPHATGFFAVNSENEILQFKASLPALNFTRLDPWTNLKHANLKTFIGHNRYATQGSSKNNKNNHPHISSSGNIALVHNGTLYKYHKYKNSYNLSTECDSELILKIILGPKNIIEGIKKVYELFGSTGNFACQLIYRNPDSNSTTYYFFRDPGRPGKFINAKNTLNQLFFTSTTKIWKNVIKDIKNKELSEISSESVPPYEIWKISAETLEIEKISVPRVNRERKIWRTVRPNSGMKWINPEIRKNLWPKEIYKNSYISHNEYSRDQDSLEGSGIIMSKNETEYEKITETLRLAYVAAAETAEAITDKLPETTTEKLFIPSGGIIEKFFIRYGKYHDGKYTIDQITIQYDSDKELYELYPDISNLEERRIEINESICHVLNFLEPITKKLN